mgnify:CR=1 FL=1
MSDVYGSIVVNFSTNFKGNKAMLVEALNVYEFTSDGSQFLLNETSQHIYLNNSRAQCPSLFPMRSVSAYFYEKNSNVLVEKKWDDVDEEDEELLYDFICEQVELSEIAERCSEFIDDGSIYLSETSKQKSIYKSRSSLQINANGTAKRSLHLQLHGNEPTIISEEV